MSNIDNQPLRYWNGNAVYLSLYLAAALGIGTIVTFFIESSDALPTMLMFHNGMFFRGAYWQPLTYIFVNDLNLFTPLALIMFYIWGVESEKYLGRKRFCALLGLLLATPVLVLILCYYLNMSGELAGDRLLLAGLLVSFAALYPNMDYFYGWIPLKWFAFAVIACGSMTYFPRRDWPGLMSLWATCLAAYLFVQTPEPLANFRFRNLWPRRKPKLRVLPRPDTRSAPARQRKAAPATGSEAEVDTLLDKIARSGLQSLTEAERERLEKARLEMLKKEL